MSIYCATKFGVRGLTEALDAELTRYGIRVTSLMPWFIDTAILDGFPAEGSNRRVRDALNETKTPIYPVSMAAERAWTPPTATSCTTWLVRKPNAHASLLGSSRA